MSDLIRRADAIEAVHKYFVKEIDKTPHEIDEDGDDVYTDMPTVNSLFACNKELSKALKALPSAEQVTGKLKKTCDSLLTGDSDECKEQKSKLESAEAVQGWIPVEEQPPEFPCLVCDANENQPSVPLGIVTITDEEHGEWHIDGRLWDSPKVFVDGEWGSQLGYGNRIIAWMPLPTPYKGGDPE